jgi:hypothetical protein
MATTSKLTIIKQLATCVHSGLPVEEAAEKKGGRSGCEDSTNVPGGTFCCKAVVLKTGSTVSGRKNQRRFIKRSGRGQEEKTA